MNKMVSVMLLFGGESSEHTVSISSARNVFAALDSTKFDVILSYIDKTGKWWLLNDLEQVGDIDQASELMPVLGDRCFVVVDTNQRAKPDVILPILHGENGEDGTVQGLARLLHIPIVGCGVAASAVCIDKVLTKQILESNGIITVPYDVHYACEVMPKYDDLYAKFGSNLFIKPSGCGSSVGVSKVTNEAELTLAIDEAHKYDSKVLVEKAIKARELEVAIIGNGSDARASVVGEIIPDRGFYDFESKYSDSSQSRVIIPAELEQDISDSIRTVAVKAYQAIGCSGLARVDFFLSDNNAIYLNEINTLPGFTNISMYPKLLMNDGLTYPKLIEKLIDLALNNR
jgi:D-alanine-D-alanine ligase